MHTPAQKALETNAANQRRRDDDTTSVTDCPVVSLSVDFWFHAIQLALSFLVLIGAVLSGWWWLVPLAFCWGIHHGFCLARNQEEEE